MSLFYYSMSQRKLLFFVISVIVIIGIFIIINKMNNENKNKNSAPKTLTLWINEGTTESYKGIIDGFKEYAPDYAKTTIIIEKKTQDPGQYRTLLLNTMANDGGPDIFQVRQGEDIVLKNQIEPIPTEVIPTEDFEKKYEDIFLSLLYST